MNRNASTSLYMWTLIIAGFFCVAVSIFYFPVPKVDIYLLILFAFTIGIGSRVTIQIPRFKSHIAVSDTFIFLALLLYGGQIAIILAAIEAVFSSWRFCKKKITVLVNLGVMAISTTVVAVLLIYLNLLPEVQSLEANQNWSVFVVTLSLMTLTQFSSNTLFATLYSSLKSGEPIWEMWKTKYIWSFLTYLVGAICAGILFVLTHTVGFGVVIVAFPIILLVYQSYKMYLQNVEMSITQAEQAKEHADLLEERTIALQDSEEKFRSAFDYAPIGIALVSPQGKWLKVNRALSKILGYTEEEFFQKDFQSMILKEDLGDTLIKIHELTSGKAAACQLEQRYLHKNNNIVWSSWSVSAIYQKGSSQPNLIFQIQDITDKKIAEEKLQYEATHDSLTNLPNRALFMSRLEKALEKAHDNPTHKVSLLFIDLDRFKVVNDSLGHIVGDQLLIKIADNLKDCLRPSDLVARLGGDEFIILVEGKFEQSEIINIAERIQEKFVQPFNLNGIDVYSSASIGVLQSTKRHLAAEEMMRDADTAMYQAKRAGKARHEVFDPNMYELAKETLQLETDLRRAVENKEFTVFYQPIYSICDEQIKGFEALARWEHSSLGIISPTKFIPLAEELGLINALGEQILRQACLQMRLLQTTHIEAESYLLNVNLSCRQFAQSNLVETIKKVLSETDFPAKKLQLEITETVFFEQKERAIEMLKKLRDLEIEIHIDDFGTGYSNLSYLTQLPISTLKIDRSFIESMGRESQNLEIVQTIITLARSLGMKVIAEGVETKMQLEALRKLNCEGAQGFYFSEPMCFEDTRLYIQTATNNIPQSFEELPIIGAIQ